MSRTHLAGQRIQMQITEADLDAIHKNEDTKGLQQRGKDQNQKAAVEPRRGGENPKFKQQAKGQTARSGSQK